LVGKAAIPKCVFTASGKDGFGLPFTVYLRRIEDEDKLTSQTY